MLSDSKGPDTSYKVASLSKMKIGVRHAWYPRQSGIDAGLIYGLWPGDLEASWFSGRAALGQDLDDDDDFVEKERFESIFPPLSTRPTGRTFLSPT
jgi:hypothetical protein